MTPVGEFPGYKPEPTKLDFQDVQHNSKMLEHLENLSYVIKSIAIVHTDHIGVQTLEHELRMSVKGI